MRRYGLASAAGPAGAFRSAWVVFSHDRRGLVGWWVGRMDALPEREPIVLRFTGTISDARRRRWISKDYVKGVVAAEMPTTFHLEALKAQAVAARTLALHLLQRKPAPARSSRSDHQHRLSHAPGLAFTRIRPRGVGHLLLLARGPRSPGPSQRPGAW